MTLTVATRQVTVTCIELAIDPADPGGDPKQVPFTGQVTFTPSLRNGKLLDASDLASLGVDTRAVAVDGTGVASAFLVRTDLPGFTPVDWVWTVSFQLNGADWDPFSFELPDGAGPLDLTTVEQITPPPEGVPATGLIVLTETAGAYPVRPSLAAGHVLFVGADTPPWIDGDLWFRPDQ